MKNIGEYSDLYLKTDVLLLSDIFENFRKSCRADHGLDSAQYFTLPGFSCDAILKYTEIVLKVITDVEMLLLIKKGMYLYS